MLELWVYAGAERVDTIKCTRYAIAVATRRHLIAEFGYTVEMYGVSNGQAHYVFEV